MAEDTAPDTSVPFDDDADFGDPSVDVPTGPPPGMTLVPADKSIEEVVKAQTATDPMSQIAQAIREGFKGATKQKVSISEFDPKCYVQEGLPKKMKSKLKRKVYQNGFRLNPNNLSNTEIDGFNAIRGGRYLNRTMEVIVRDEGTASEAVELRYSNKTFDQRMTNKGLWRNLGELVTIIQEEMAEADQREEARLVGRPMPPKRVLPAGVPARRVARPRVSR